jgi:hypothetical protein
MTCLFIGVGIAVLAVIYALIAVCTLNLHQKGPYDPPFLYFSIGFLVLTFLFMSIGALQVIFGNA